jgi:tripartite-type tricarboxylate transporter receptor subunit TctC
MLASAGAAEPYVRAGKLNALAQTTRERLALLPDVPTFAEIGFPGIAARDWQGVVAPAGTPRPIVEELSRAISKALENPELLKRLVLIGMEPVHDSGPREFDQFLDSEIKRWAAIAKASGLQAQ